MGMATFVNVERWNWREIGNTDGYGDAGMSRRLSILRYRYFGDTADRDWTQQTPSAVIVLLGFLYT